MVIHACGDVFIGIITHALDDTVLARLRETAGVIASCGARVLVAEGSAQRNLIGYTIDDSVRRRVDEHRGGSRGHVRLTFSCPAKSPCSKLICAIQMASVTVRELVGGGAPRVAGGYNPAAPVATTAQVQRDVRADMRQLLMAANSAIPLTEQQANELLFGTGRANGGPLMMANISSNDPAVVVDQALNDYDGIIEMFNVVRRAPDLATLAQQVDDIIKSTEEYPWCVPDALPVKEESDFRYGLKIREIEQSTYRGKCSAGGCPSKRFVVLDDQTRRGDEYQPSTIICLECGTVFIK